MATDPETGETGSREVVAELPHTDELLELDTSAGEIVTTEDHRYWNETDGEWQEAQDLDTGDRLRTADGDVVTVEGLDWTTVRTAPAYDLTVADLHTFYVTAGPEAVLVHNCNIPVIGSKLDYLFGRATGNLHNVARSRDMLRQLEAIGVRADDAGYSYLRQHLRTVFNDPSSVVRTQANGRTIRESLLTGPRGAQDHDSVGG